MKDIIRFTPDPAPATTNSAKNTGDQTGHGIEWEVNWKAGKALTLTGNYAYQHTIDESTDSDAGNAPRHHIYARGDWRFLPSWNVNTQVNWVAKRMRVAGDNRPQIADYTTVDMTLRRAQERGPWEAALSVHNLFDADAREPSLAGNPITAIPHDLPLPGRNFFAELRYKM